ncbi:CopD family protein [Pelomicrobium methylotrophicum]|uniref:Copper resistance protein D domain-containing protein n=1 Tax=Pelomicrobium methylotrophicum TaxID=2602750 RepID=A0A5C7EQ96_9PROT|nr:CopD family protein [Pelomicrobium methylotrophicum]TXF13660.1 hypothetical protein FR698_00665 [Pelomicrobium methylotrophicum]
MHVAIFLHILSAVVWIGGMFFAYLALRPAALETLEPPARLKLWAAVFRRFFSWVWAAVILILLSGFHMVSQIGSLPGYILAMLVIGIVMAVIFFYVYFLPFTALKRGCAAEDWKAAGAALSQIRVLVGINLALGLVNVAVATLGPLLS